MAYTAPQIGLILLKADRTMYKIGQIAYDNMFAEDNEALDYERDIIFIYKKAVEYADDLFLGTEKLDKVVEKLAAKISAYDYGALNPIYADVSTVNISAIVSGSSLNDLTDVTITNLQDNQYLRYDASTGQWVNEGPGSAIRNSQAFTATAGQTIFITAYPFVNGLFDLYLNGVKLNSASYNTLGQYQITLIDGCTVGDILDIVIYDTTASIIPNPVTSWGSITGTLSNQTDLQNALNAKFDDPTGTTAQYLRGDGTLATFPTITSGTVTSVGLTMPTAFTVANSPVTSSGTLAVTGAGTTSQYVRGDGSLDTFPSLTGFVPYTGATANVNLGTHTILAQNATISSSGSGNTATITHSSGSGIALNITKGGNGEGLYINKTGGSGNAATIIGTLNATTLVKSGGTSTQYLMADGSVSTLTNPITGTGTSGQVSYWSGTSTQAGSSTFLWNAASNLLRVNGGIGINRDVSGTRALDVSGGGIRLTGSTSGSFEVNGSNSSFNVSTVGGIAGINITDTSNAIISLIGNSYNYSILSNASSFKIRDVTASNADRLLIYSTGNVGINTSSDSGQRLQVTGDTLLKGSGNTSGTAALTVNNSDGTSILGAFNNRTVYIGSASGSFHALEVNPTANATRIAKLGFLEITTTGPGWTGVGISVLGNNRTLTFSGVAASSINAADTSRVLFAAQGGTWTRTSGTAINVQISDTQFAPTSGTASYFGLYIGGGVNQTGGASGISRGLYIDYNIVAAADWRSIEWSNNTGWGLYGAGTANNYMAGRLAIGTTSTTANLTLFSSIVDAPSATNKGSFQIAFSTTNGLSFGTYSTSPFANYIQSISATQGNSGVYPLSLNPNGGAILIGATTSSGEALQVTGTAKITGATTFGSSVIASGLISAATEFRLNNQSFTRVAITDTGGGFAGGYNLALSSGITPIHDSTGGISGVHYRSGGTILFYTGSSQTAGTTATERMRLSSAGNLAIGAASDSGERLQVTGTAKITGATSIGGNLTVDTNVLFVDTTNNRVGIGTAFPDHPLTIQTAGTGLGVRIIGYQGDNFLHLNNTLSTGNRTYQILAGITGIGYNGLSIYDSVAAQTRFVIDNSGNVGLGLNAPTERLHVSGNGIITGNLTVDTNTLFVDATNNRVGIGTVSPTYTLTTVVPSSTNADIFLAGMTGVSNGFTVQRVSSNFVYTFLDGNVGIGITPTEKLHVSGNAIITGNLTVDSSTLFVDATANEVGIGTSSPNSSLQVVGSVSKSISDVKTANYTATATDHTILCSAASGGITITLPASSGIAGRIYVIKKTNASSGVNSVTVDGNGAETIDGSASINLACRSSVTLQCDGSNWHILSLYSDTSCL